MDAEDVGGDAEMGFLGEGALLGERGGGVGFLGWETL